MKWASVGREKIDVLEWIERYLVRNLFLVVTISYILEALGMVLATYRSSLRYFEHLSSVGRC